MDNNIHVRYDARDRSYFSILKKEIHHTSSNAGFSATKVGEIDIIVAEMTSNLLKHAGGGEIFVRLFNDNQNQCIEIISIDSGPGISDPSKMLEDGMSTANTLGHGLGAMKRLSDIFEIYSLKGWGTIVLSRVYQHELPYTKHKPILEIRPLMIAKPGETLSGDGYSYRSDAQSAQVFLGDGLGHGPEANKAVRKAIEIFDTNAGSSITDTVRLIHTGVKRTRGLVGTIASFSLTEKKWSICGIGNINTRTQSGLNIKGHMSYNGILGLNVPNTIKEQEIAYERGQMLIMCSDGIKTRYDLQKYPGIFKYDLSVVAAAIFKDNARETDDMSVIVARINLS